MQEVWEDYSPMTIQEAKTILKTYGYPNVRKHIEALQIAVGLLGEDATMSEIWAWAEGRMNDNNQT